MTDLGEQPKPNWKEAFQGKDVVGGETLVDNLLYEGVGTPVYYRNLREKKVQFLIDKNVGEEDVTIRQKEEQNNKLIGLLISTSDKNEFVFLGINEGGFVFRTGERKASEFHKDTASSFTMFGSPRFTDYVSFLVQMGYPPKETSVILKEEDDPSRFSEVVLTSVKNERERMQLNREKRANVREDLLKKLFGEQQ